MNPSKVYHGGCLGCVQQNKHGLKFCNGCKYKRCDWDLPDLSIIPERYKNIDRENAYRKLDKIDINLIESYLRMKKLDKLK